MNLAVRPRSSYWAETEREGFPEPYFIFSREDDTAINAAYSRKAGRVLALPEEMQRRYWKLIALENAITRTKTPFKP